MKWEDGVLKVSYLPDLGLPGTVGVSDQAGRSRWDAYNGRRGRDLDVDLETLKSKHATLLGSYLEAHEYELSATGDLSIRAASQGLLVMCHEIRRGCIPDSLPVFDRHIHDLLAHLKEGGNVVLQSPTEARARMVAGCLLVAQGYSSVKAGGVVWDPSIAHYVSEAQRGYLSYYQGYLNGVVRVEPYKTVRWAY